MQLQSSSAGATANTKLILPLARGNVFYSVHFQALRRGHSRQQNVTPVTGRVTLPWRSSAQLRWPRWLLLLAAKYQSGAPRKGEHPFPSSSLSAPLLCLALPESCRLQQLLLRRDGPANPPAVGGNIWTAKKQCNAHAKRGAMLIAKKSSDAAYVA